LAGFTNTGRPNGRFYILDKSQKKQWAASPKDTAHRRDYHAVNLGPKVDRMIVEKKLAIIEGQQSAVLQSIVDSQTLPRVDSEEFAVLLGFVALLAVRVPFIRNRIAEFIDTISKKELFATFSTPQGKATFRQALKEHLDEMPPDQRAMARKCIEDDTELEKLATFACSNNYTVSFEQTWDVQTMLINTTTLMPLLASRNWALWLAAGEATDLICSDHPVCLNWLTDAGTRPPGFGLRNTVVSIPLNRRMVLVGTFEPLSERKTIGNEAVALINTSALMQANQVFSADADFIWLKTDRTIARVDDLLATLK
jgi:hypothetical protein